MIYKATRLIKQEMDDAGIKYAMHESEERSYISAGFGIDNGPSVRVDFISRDDDNDVAMRVFGLLNNVAADKADAVLKVVNECNSSYRFLKFVFDKDNDVNIEYDFPTSLGDKEVGRTACVLFANVWSIAEKVYPEFMKAIWGI